MRPGERSALETGADSLRIELNGEAPSGNEVLCAMQAIPAGAEVPEWIHVLPKGPKVETYDGRGPYVLDDPAGVVAASLHAATDRGAVIDENHATDWAAPSGLPSPARGWFTGFEARPDGIWGRVEWNAAGKALLADRSYRGISPAVLLQPGTNRIRAVTRASLVNRPNIKGQTALNMENDMNLLAELAKKLGLADGASQEAVIAAVDKLSSTATELNAQLPKIARAAGLQENATAEAILGEVGNLAKRPVATGDAKTVEALQTELNAAVTRINELEGSGKKAAAEAFVDQAIREKRAGVSARREEYIALHMENPARAKSIIEGLPILGPSHTFSRPPTAKDGEIELNAEQLAVARLTGVDPEKMKETLRREAAAKEEAI